MQVLGDVQLCLRVVQDGGQAYDRIARLLVGRKGERIAQMTSVDWAPSVLLDAPVEEILRLLHGYEHNVAVILELRRSVLERVAVAGDRPHHDVPICAQAGGQELQRTPVASQRRAQDALTRSPLLHVVADGLRRKLKRGSVARDGFEDQLAVVAQLGGGVSQGLGVV